MANENERRGPYGGRRAGVGASDRAAQPADIGEQFQTFPKVRVDLSEGRDGEGLGGDRAAELMGTHLWAENASSPGAWMNIAFNGEAGELNKHYYRKQLQLKTPGFRRIHIYNDPQPGEWIELAWYDQGEPRPDAVEVVQAPVPLATANDIPPAGTWGTSHVQVAANATDTVLGSKSSRRGLFIQNDPELSTNAVRVGASGDVDAQTGTVLYPGDGRPVSSLASGITPAVDAHNLADVDNSDVHLQIDDLAD